MDKITLNQEVATLQLINRHFWKSKVGPISALAIPLFLMAIFKIVSKDELSVFTEGLPSFISFSILPFCFVSLPLMLVEFKTSIILRKISNSRISIAKFITIVLSFNLLAIIAAILFIFCLFAIFLNKDAPQIFNNIKWGEFIYAMLNVIMCGLLFGLMLGIMINKINLIQIIGFCFVIISITFSGQFIPLVVLYRSKIAGYISLFSPMSYSLNLMNVSLLPNNAQTILDLINNSGLQLLPNAGLEDKMEILENYDYKGIFDLSNTFKIFTWSYIYLPADQTNPDQLIIPRISKIIVVDVYHWWQNVLNIVMPYFLSALALIYSINQFKWTSR